MALVIATQNFTVEISGADVEVARGDFFDTTTAVYIANPGGFAALPDGITSHRISNDWEG